MVEVNENDIEIRIEQSVIRYASVDLESCIYHGGIDDAIYSGDLDWDDEDEQDHSYEIHVSGVVKQATFSNLKGQLDAAREEVQKLKKELQELKEGITAEEKAAKESKKTKKVNV